VSHRARLPNKENENKQRNIGVENCLYGKLDSTHVYSEHMIEKKNERNNGLYGELTGILKKNCLYGKLAITHIYSEHIIEKKISEIMAFMAN
jgi:hypothetical protein